MKSRRSQSHISPLSQRCLCLNLKLIPNFLNIIYVINSTLYSSLNGVVFMCTKISSLYVQRKLVCFLSSHFSGLLAIQVHHFKPEFPAKVKSSYQTGDRGER